MRAINAVTKNQQSLYTRSMPSAEKAAMEIPPYSYEVKDWEEVTFLVPFYASGQCVGADGKCYQMAAEYTDDATKVFPKVRVTITDESGNISEYHIDITKVDTGNATEIEMFALCSHADTKRERNTLSSWESLLFYRDMAQQEEYVEQSSSGVVTGTEKYNWRDMVGDVAERYKNDGIYDCYLHINRMKDMLDYYSHFEGRPDAFENSFHAIRDYEFIRVLSLDGGANIEIYDKQKKIVCSDTSLEFGSEELWSRELTEEEFIKAIEIAGSSHKAYMKDYSFWDEILSGMRQIEDYDAK